MIRLARIAGLLALVMMLEGRSAEADALDFQIRLQAASAAIAAGADANAEFRQPLSLLMSNGPGSMESLAWKQQAAALAQKAGAQQAEFAYLRQIAGNVADATILARLAALGAPTTPLLEAGDGPYQLQVDTGKSTHVKIDYGQNYAVFLTGVEAPYSNQTLFSGYGGGGFALGKLARTWPDESCGIVTNGQKVPWVPAAIVVTTSDFQGITYAHAAWLAFWIPKVDTSTCSYELDQPFDTTAHYIQLASYRSDQQLFDYH